MRQAFWIFDLRFLILILLVAGCVDGGQRAPDQSSTAINPATTQPSYWLSQPATAVASASDFEQLVRACEDVTRQFFFRIDRVDYRAGLITSVPLVSSQWFEPWRPDNQTLDDVEESSLATIRRTIRYEFTRQPDESWQVAPKVLVERQAIAEKRITSVVLYRSVFGGARGRLRPSGSREIDQGVVLSPRYWYLLRRDTDFERVIAQALESKLHRASH